MVHPAPERPKGQARFMPNMPHNARPADMRCGRYNPGTHREHKTPDFYIRFLRLIRLVFPFLPLAPQGRGRATFNTTQYK